jgi:pSer/pThr/pTyr-binding forkhead associated (FHA) protein
VTADGATVSDLGSKNGTLVDGRRLDAPAELADGSEIQVGTVTLTVRSAPGHGPTATLPLPGLAGRRGGGVIDPGEGEV